MDQQLVLGVLIGVLVLVSAFQTLQLSQLNAQVQSASVGGQAASYSTSGSQAQASGQQVQLPAGIANAPNMVGGC